MAKNLGICANIESVYSTTPKKITEPRFSYKITVGNRESSLENDDDDDGYYGLLQKRMHIILCYKNQSNGNNEEYYGLHVGGWLKESLGSVLVEQPILAGRLRRSENGGLEIVSNDSGVRCVEVQLPLTLEEFLETNQEAEGKLVYWQDIEKSNPQFSPLFYLQVTKFQCGGYSLGISCSLLLSDPSNMATFLKRWAGVHRRMASETEVPRTLLPTYTVNFKDGFSGLDYGATHVSSPLSTASSNTLIFNIISTHQHLYHSMDDDVHKYFILLCLEEAATKFATNLPSNITLITKQPNGDVIVEFFPKQVNYSASPKHLKYELTCLSWEDLRMNEVDFHKEKGILDASLKWTTTCDALEGVVVSAISSLTEDKSDVKVYVTFPRDPNIY